MGGKSSLHVNSVTCVFIWKLFPPRNLPAKSVEEALRHRQEYDEMVAEAKKRGIINLKIIVLPVSKMLNT